jgi:hypothetical protein
MNNGFPYTKISLGASAHSRPMVSKFSRRPRTRANFPCRGVFIHMAQPHRSRRAGSCRFSVYYKVQYWDPRNCAWHDVQKQYPTREAAAAAYPEGRRCRVMQITPTGRRPV